MAEASRSDVEVQIMKPPHPMEVPVDADLIKQILINLIHNASEAMQDKGIVTVRISQKNQYRGHFLWKSDISTPLACIEVEDQGIGIEEANLARVIEPFYTTKALSARHGTGLGLSMVYEMAKEMDAFAHRRITGPRKLFQNLYRTEVVSGSPLEELWMSYRENRNSLPPGKRRTQKS